MAQQDLTDIFRRLKLLIKKYEGKLKPKVDTESEYDLWSLKDITAADRNKNEMYFTGIIIHKKYVGFYYMPVYTDAELIEGIDSELIKLLKGKSCFHIKKLDEILEKQIDNTLKAGYELYEKRGWI